MPTVDAAGFPLFYREYGDAALPPLVLVHGLYGDSSTMAPIAEALAESFHVVTPDAIGHGQSVHPEDFTLADQGRALNALTAALGYHSAVLVGVSMGSYLAAEAAILEPTRTSALVLVVPKAHGMTSSSVAYAQRMGVDLATATPEETMALMAGAVWSPDTSEQRRAELLAFASEPQVVLTAAERAAVERSLAGFDLRPDLSAITAPTLVVSGRSDGLNPPESGEEVARHIRNARFEVYEHSGHMLPYEELDRLVADITAFVLA